MRVPDAMSYQRLSDANVEQYAIYAHAPRTRFISCNVWCALCDSHTSTGVGQATPKR
jgi:hypothetical protein